MDIHGRGRVAHALHAGDADRRRQLRAARGRVALGRLQLRPQHGAGHALLRGRQDDHGDGREPARDRPRPRHRTPPVELRRADDVAARVLDAEGVREGRRLRGDRRARRRLHHQSRLLPLRPGRGNRAAARELGHAGAAAGLPLHGNGGSGQGSHRRLGTVGEPERGVRPGSGDAARNRLHHRLLPSHRRQRCGRRRQLGRAGIQPDPEGDGPGRYLGLRRPHGRVQVEVPHHPAAGRVRARDVGERRVAVDR